MTHHHHHHHHNQQAGYGYGYGYGSGVTGSYMMQQPFSQHQRQHHQPYFWGDLAAFAGSEALLQRYENQHHQPHHAMRDLALSGMAAYGMHHLQKYDTNQHYQHAHAGLADQRMLPYYQNNFNPNGPVTSMYNPSPYYPQQTYYSSNPYMYQGTNGYYY
ncbi:hypothetical protein DM01DRAFT_1333227 [Hesseltinella vesiculosa]|uniref:Uncharacterized protein n=1 Tax=Hesseltinella vesiculosa TaxID=101127 RepID=A0A1X2GRU1_9FUNG|nr:hypothetical protein DM01DRAFT_1333227 [Hesseltinella vesiculosa]